MEKETFEKAKAKQDEIIQIQASIILVEKVISKEKTKHAVCYVGDDRFVIPEHMVSDVAKMCLLEYRMNLARLLYEFEQL